MNYAYERNEQIIKSKTREFLGIGSVVTASAYLDYVIDFILIGGILGADAVAAAGLCDSMVDIAEFPGFVLSSGGSIAAGILLGKRKRQQANVVFTVSFLLALLGGLLCCCLLPFCDLFSGILTNNGTIAGDVSRYTFLALLSAPLTGVNLALSSFAILDNHSKLAMAQVITSNVANLALDFLFMGCMDMGVSRGRRGHPCGDHSKHSGGLPISVFPQTVLSVCLAPGGCAGNFPDPLRLLVLLRL